jgi:hypothetical protein
LKEVQIPGWTPCTSPFSAAEMKLTWFLVDSRWLRLIILVDLLEEMADVVSGSAEGLEARLLLG